MGLAVHEEPSLSRIRPSTLAAGHLVTVEPGIYLPGWGGVRIEDVALVTEDGAEILTRAAERAHCWVAVASLRVPEDRSGALFIMEEGKDGT